MLFRSLKKYDLALYKKTRWLVLNKADILDDIAREKARKDMVRRLRWKGPVYVISAASGTGCNELMQAIMTHLESLPSAAQPHAEAA